MKMKVLLLFGCLMATYATAGTHNLVLKFTSSVNINDVLKDFTVTSVKKLNQKEQYKVVIESDLTKEVIIDQIFSGNTNMATVEENQRASLIDSTVSATELDERRRTEVDEIDERVRTVLDEDELLYGGVFSQSFVFQTATDHVWGATQGRNVVVAVIDTGVDINHPYLAGNIVQGYDFVDNDYDPSDVRGNLDTNQDGIIDGGYGHGTHVAGIVRAIAPDVKIMPIRVCDSDGDAELFNIIEGISYALYNGADVINLSMSIPDPSPLLISWLEAAKDAEVVVVTSAGNNNNTDLQYPAKDTDVLTVASIDPYGYKSSFSNYSTYVDIVGFGDGIWSAHPEGYYVDRSGTSMATPMVSGLAALILQLAPSANASFVRYRITSRGYSVNSYNPAYIGMLGTGLMDTWRTIYD